MYPPLLDTVGAMIQHLVLNRPLGPINHRERVFRAGVDTVRARCLYFDRIILLLKRGIFTDDKKMWLESAPTGLRKGLLIVPKEQ